MYLNRAKRKLRRILKIPLWKRQPEYIQFDTQNKCNLSCLHCNVKEGGSFNLPRQSMPQYIVNKVLDYFNYNILNLYGLAFWMNGEPLLEERLNMFHSMAKKKYCIVDTNGTVTKYREKLLHENISLVRFTINASNRDTYELIHGKDLFHEALRNLYWFRDNKKGYQKIEINHIVNKHNIDELKDFINYFNGFNINIFPVHYGETQKNSIKHYTNRAGRVYIKNNGKKIYPRETNSKRLPCPCWNILPIGNRGEIMHCTDFSPEYNYGYIQNDDIIRAWEERNKTKCNHELCKTCSVRFKNHAEHF